MPKKTGVPPAQPQLAPSHRQVAQPTLQQAQLRQKRPEEQLQPQLKPNKPVAEQLRHLNAASTAPAPSAISTMQQEQLESGSQPLKKLKGDNSEQAARGEKPVRPRQREGGEREGDPGGLAQPASPKPKKQRSHRGPAGGIAWALSTIRAELETIIDVDGVQEHLKSIPECVLLGGIAARRELVAALLGESGNTMTAAAALVAPGMRQPLALEFRASSQGVDLDGRDAEHWLQSVAKATERGLGNRLKLEPLRLRLSTLGCATLDVIDLPERNAGAGGVLPPKLEEIRMNYLGSEANILVCLEPGVPMELCRRFDPQQRRTVLVGAAHAANGSLPASELCGAAAARALEERFAALCLERAPTWLTGIERLEGRLSRAKAEAGEVEQHETADEVLRRARAAGISFGRALEHVVGGTPGCQTGALTLEEELNEFAAAAVKGQCGAGTTLSGADAAAAAADMFAGFDGVKGYTAYLRNDVSIPGAEVPLNGGAAWNRLLSELEVAMRLAHPPPEELAGLALAAVRCGGTGVHGHQRWEDISSKLMLSMAFHPLRKRIRYIAARVAWSLRQQKATIAEWMAMMSEGPAARFHSPLFAQHLAILRSSPIARDLVFGAYDGAAAAVAEQVLKNLQGTLTAGCINPNIMLRPKTEPDMDPSKMVKMTDEQRSKSGRTTEARKRVKAEMSARENRRRGPSGGLPPQLRDKVFEPSEAIATLPFVEAKLRYAFSVLTKILANQAFAFADTALASLCRRHVDEAMSAIDFSPEQRRVLDARHSELKTISQQVDTRLEAVRRCLSALRSVRM
eukprot:TRINITY_DN9221_c0_g1_i1.p1 TRINITY_DN9221_c0_g1~~TRINITY_DN9221_c0_g1_i1.p1  ORF type:complete len:801 (+),score=143.58 TRINITY_DN9221_c0_g1_i1:112-2514(+)